jgi:hypothetical protein
MAGSKISALTPAESVVGDELMYAVKDGADVSLTPDQLSNPMRAYTETGATLTFVAEASGDIEVPLDGKVYSLTITGDCSIVTGPSPTAPKCGSAMVYMDIDTATPPVIAIDGTWCWPDAAVTDIPTADGAMAELVLNSTPQGLVVARVTELGVPA